MTATAVLPGDLVSHTTEPAAPMEALRLENEALRARLSELELRLEDLEAQIRGAGDPLTVVRVTKAAHPLIRSCPPAEADASALPPAAAPGDAPSLRDLINALTAGATWSRPPEGARDCFLHGKDRPFLIKVGGRLGRRARRLWLVGAVGLALLTIVVLLLLILQR